MVQPFMPFGYLYPLGIYTLRVQKMNKNPTAAKQPSVTGFSEKEKNNNEPPDSGWEVHLGMYNRAAELAKKNGSGFSLVFAVLPRKTRLLFWLDVAGKIHFSPVFGQVPVAGPCNP